MFEVAGTNYILDVLPYILIATACFFVLFVTLKIWRAVFSKKVKSINVSGMQFQDLDTLRKKGLVSDEEYKRIRGTMARREAERSIEHERAEAERQIIEQMQLDPGAARTAALKLLTPEELAEARQRQAAGHDLSEIQSAALAHGQPAAEPPPVAEPATAPEQPAAQAATFPPASPAAQPELAPQPPSAAPRPPTGTTGLFMPETQASPEPRPVRSAQPAQSTQHPQPPVPQTPPTPPPAEPRTEFEALDPLGGLAEEPAAPQPPKPSMNNPRVVHARNAARAAQRGEGGEGGEGGAAAAPPSKSQIDELLEKGAITPEEHARLKQYFQ